MLCIFDTLARQDGTVDTVRALFTFNTATTQPPPKQTTNPHTKPPDPKQWFDAIDKDKDGKLTAPELQSALQLGGLNFSLATTAHIIRIHDRSGSGAISFEEFVDLEAFLKNVQASYEYFDSRGTGFLTPDDIGAALAHAGYRLDKPALASVFSRFDPTRRGALGLAEFLALTLFLRR